MRKVMLKLDRGASLTSHMGVESSAIVKWRQCCYVNATHGCAIHYPRLHSNPVPLRMREQRR